MVDRFERIEARLDELEREVGELQEWCERMIKWRKMTEEFIGDLGDKLEKAHQAAIDAKEAKPGYNERVRMNALALATEFYQSRPLVQADPKTVCEMADRFERFLTGMEPMGKGWQVGVDMHGGTQLFDPEGKVDVKEPD